MGSTTNESLLHKMVALPERDLPLTIVFDLREFASDKLNNVTKEADTLAKARESEYIDRQPFDVRQGLDKAINEARYEQHWWYTVETLLGNLCHEALHSK